MPTLATWNVNSLKVRLPHVVQWLAKNPVDALCLQELKLSDDSFPHAELHAAGYQAVLAGQKTYNGVAILTPITQAPVIDVHYNLPNFDDVQRRLIAATLANGTRVICGYFPNGQAVGSEKYTYKLSWLDALRVYIQQQLDQYLDLALGGDYNIAPTDADVYDPVAWQDQLHCSMPERRHFQALLDLGLSDAYRCFEQAPETYTWWDYRLLGFQKNKGLRIDHWLVSGAIRQRLTACTIDRTPRKWIKPSDHAPVLVTF